MANAWCINAYDCNGCLIQTLQTLDSACIGVGVQYTAPNPLDDKRLDYIKYTDKCGCTCCLSWENEILIYATNGVIKNLTLTNDDVNEAIKIKWNEVFGSNRAKTIVRYKTWSYPVSITDGTLAVEETTKNQYSSTPFSLSGVLDETTYYITAFAVDSNNAVISSQQATIKTDFWWHPSANTLLYFPLINNAVDSVNGVNLTSYWTTNYTTIWWIKSAEFTKSNWLYNTSVNIIPQWNVEKTFSVWAYIKWWNSWWQWFVQCWSSWTWNVFWLWLYTGKYTVVMTRYWSTSNEYTPTLNKWTNFIVTYKNSVWKLYVDWELKITWNTTAPTNWYNLYIGQNVEDSKTTWTFYWNISNVILENKEWTLADAQSYYNKTKSQYWY